MPVMNGLQAAPVVRKLVAKSSTILFTLYASQAVDLLRQFRTRGCRCLSAYDFLLPGAWPGRYRPSLPKPRAFDAALAAIQTVVTSSAEIGNIPTWWVSTLTVHLVRDLWNQSLFVRLPSGSGTRIVVPRYRRRQFVAHRGTVIAAQCELSAVL